MIRRTQWIPFQIVFALVFVFSSVSWGDVTKDDLLKKIDQTKKKLNQNKIQEKQVVSKLTQTQQQVDRIVNNLTNLNSRLGKTQKSMLETQSQLDKTQSQLDQIKMNMMSRREVLDRRLVTIYKYGYQSYFEVLFNAKNFGEFISRFEMVGDFVRDDIQKIHLFQQQREEINLKKEQISEHAEELERQKNLYAKLQSQTLQEHKLYISKAQEQQSQLEKIKNDRQFLEQSLDELDKESREMDSKIRDMQSKNHVSLGTGRMVWPADGRITSPFGYRMHPVLRKWKYHSGIDIAVSSGTPVQAADSGVVILSKWNGGYGNCVIIDHGQGISTLYGHNSVLLVREGETVTKGQVISRSGNTGLSTGPHLHFEVRKDGVPVDPLTYLY